MGLVTYTEVKYMKITLQRLREKGNRSRLLYSFFFFKILFIFRERGRQETQRERNIDRLPLAHALTGDQPTPQACALTRN